MPYKSSGRWVYVKRSGKWQRLRQMSSAGAAKRHATALNINVGHHNGKRGHKKK